MHRHVSVQLGAIVERLATDRAVELQQRLLLDDVVLDARVNHQPGTCPIRTSTHVTHKPLHSHRVLQLVSAKVILVWSAVPAQVAVV